MATGYSTSRKRWNAVPPHLEGYSNRDVKLRKCLACNREFESEGPGNRKCPKCTESMAESGVRSGGGLKLHVK